MFLNAIKNRKRYNINGFVKSKNKMKISTKNSHLCHMGKNKGCSSCVKSSPIATMIGIIIILFGISAFGGGYMMGWKSIVLQINDKLFPQMDYVIYGIIIGVVTHIILSYILAAFSSGYNRKRFFEESKKAKIGQCFTILNIICLMLSLFTWVLVSCFLAIILTATTITYFRTRMAEMKNTSFDLSYYGLFNKSIHSDNMSLKEGVVSTSFAFGGSLVVVIGFMQILCCSAMNYVRLSQEQYYDNEHSTAKKSDHVLSAI